MPEGSCHKMKSKYTKTQRILAVVGIVLLVGLYVAALVCSFFTRTDAAKKLLMAALFATVAIPVIIWLFQFFIGKTKRPEITEDKE